MNFFDELVEINMQCIFPVCSAKIDDFNIILHLIKQKLCGTWEADQISRGASANHGHHANLQTNHSSKTCITK